MPSSQFVAWERHLADNAPGDFLAQRLLAELIVVVEHFMAGFGDGKAKPRQAHEIAPWLDNQASRDARAARKRAGQLGLVSEIIREEKKEEAGEE